MQNEIFNENKTLKEELKATRNQLELLKQENDKNKKEIENHNKIN